MEQQSTSSSKSSLLFFLRFFYLSTRILSVLMIESSASIHWLTSLTNFFPSFWLFLVLFWILWMLVTMDKPCHGPHTSRMTTWVTVFTRIRFSVSKKWVRSWSHVFVVTYHKTLPRKLLAVRPEKVTTKEKRRKIRQAIATFFALNGIKKMKMLLIEHAG